MTMLLTNVDRLVPYCPTVNITFLVLHWTLLWARIVSVHPLTTCVPGVVAPPCFHITANVNVMRTWGSCIPFLFQKVCCLYWALKYRQVFTLWFFNFETWQSGWLESVVVHKECQSPHQEEVVVDKHIWERERCCCWCCCCCIITDNNSVFGCWG